MLLSPVQQQRLRGSAFSNSIYIWVILTPLVREKEIQNSQQHPVPSLENGLPERVPTSVFADSWFQHVEIQPASRVEARRLEQVPLAPTDRYRGNGPLQNNRDADHSLQPQLFTTSMATIAEARTEFPSGTDAQRYPVISSSRIAGVSTIGPIRRALGSVGSDLYSVLTRAVEQGASKFSPEVSLDVEGLLEKLNRDVGSIDSR